MAYGLLIYKEITSPEGTHRLEVHKDGYAGTAVEIDGLVRDSIVLSKNAGEVWDAITTSVLTFALYDTGQLDYTQFFTPNATLFKVVLKLDGVTRWTGYLTPDSYSENLVSHDTITLTARDNLGRLNDYDFSLAREQMMSARAIINAGLAVAGVAMSANFTTTKVATSPAATLVVDGLVNTSLFVGGTWHDALVALLEGLGLTMSWNDANTIDIADVGQDVSSAQSAFFINKSGFRQIRPAWKNVTVDQDYGLRDNFYEGRFSREDCGNGTTFTPPTGGPWSVGGSMALLNPYVCGAASPIESIFPPIGTEDTLTNQMTYTFHAPTMDRAIKMAVKCSNSAWRPGVGRGGTWAQPKIVVGQSQGQNVSRYYWVRWRFNIFATIGTTKYVLRESWEVYDPATIEEPYLFFLMPGTEGGVDVDNEVTLYIAGLPGAADVEFVVYQPLVQTTEDGDPITTVGPGNYGRLTDITFSVDTGVDGRTQRVTVNADHNIQSTASFSVGRVPQSVGNTLSYFGGLFYTDADNTPLDTFKRGSSDTATYDLLELVTRERLRYNNDNYDLLSGTMKRGRGYAFVLSTWLTYDGNICRIVSAALNVLSNTLQVQSMQRFGAFPTADYVIEEVSSEGRYSSRGSYSGGSVPQGPQGGVDWFVKETYEDNGETKQRLKLNPDYTGMYAEGWITAGGLGSGSGEAGGSLATLSDVTLTNLAAGDILRYDATTSHWLNGPLAVALASLTDVAIGTPSNGQALVYDSTLGKWKPGNVGGGGEVVVVSEDATIGTSLTLLATVAGTPIKAKIAAYLLAADFTAANIVSTLGNTAVNRATKDSDGSTINHTYAAGLNTHQNRIYLQAPDNTLLAAYLDGSDIKPVIGVAATDTIATTAWVGQQGYLTSSAISDMATMTWVGQQGYLTSSAIIDMATKTWVGQQGYITSSALTGYATQTWVGQQGYLTSSSLSGYAKDILVSSNKIYLRDGSSTLSTSYLDASDIVGVIGDTPVSMANKDGDGNTISVAYLRKNIDDTMAGNLTIGGRTSTSAAKTLTIYGQTNSTYPALAIYGVASASTRYLTNIYRDSTALHIDSSVSVSGNIIATGYIDAGASASDRRLKKDIKTMDFADADYVLAALRPVTFKWNEKASELGPLSGDSRGFIADEYKEIIPNATRKMWGEYDAIDYHQVIPYLVAGWQLQQRRIEALSEEIEKLRRRLGDGI